MAFAVSGLIDLNAITPPPDVDVMDHTQATNRDAANQHPLSAIDGLVDALTAKQDKSTLATVATSGRYADLFGAPTLATVATSGSYADLSGKPAIPAVQVQTDWNAASGIAQIANRPAVATAIRPPDTADGSLAAEKAVADAMAGKANQAYVDAQIAKYASVLLYPATSTSANAGTISRTAPTGFGVTVPAWGGNLTSTNRKLFTFTYTTPSDAVIASNNRYTLELFFRGINDEKTYTMQYRYTVQHPSLNGGAVVVIFDKTRDGFMIAQGSTNEEFFQVTNSNMSDITLPAGATVTFEIWGKVTGGSSPLSLLINDANNATVVARNEVVTGLAASGITTYARGYPETQEAFNAAVWAKVSALA